MTRLGRRCFVIVLWGCATTTAPPPAGPQNDPAAPAQPAAATPTPLVVGGEVQGQLAPGGRNSHAFTIQTPKHGSYYGDGLYELELFIKKPAGQSCTAASGVTMKVIDKDDALVDGYKVGDSISSDNGDATEWKKKTGKFDFPPGNYRITLEARTWCGLDYKIRLSSLAK